MECLKVLNWPLLPISVSRSILISSTGGSLGATSMSNGFTSRSEPSEYFLSFCAPNDNFTVKAGCSEQVRRTVRCSQDVIFVNVPSAPFWLRPQIERLKTRFKYDSRLKFE